MTGKNFLGIPIEGDIMRGDKRKPQRPIEDLRPFMEAVLADEFVVEFGWQQYTPYFNDGEPCTFGTGELWFRTVNDADVEDTYKLEFSSHPTLSGRRWTGCTYVDVERSPMVVATAQRCEALSWAIESGKFEDVLLEAFGDHADITVSRTGITVEFYSHD